MPNRNVHTVHSENGWTNRYEKSNRALGYYDTKAEAQKALMTLKAKGYKDAYLLK